MSYRQAYSTDIQRPNVFMPGSPFIPYNESGTATWSTLPLIWSWTQGYGFTADATASPAPRRYELPALQPAPSTARSLLKYAGQWAGDDLDECLRDVYESRGEVSR